MITLQVPTAAGSVEVFESPARDCQCCGLSNFTEGDLVRLGVDNRETGSHELLDVCGNCLVSGLAHQFGLEHVRNGGAVADLSYGGSDPD